MNLNFKTLCSVAVLMFSVPTVFGMQGGKRSFSDESAETYSKVKMIRVSEELPKSLDKQTWEEKLKSARQERENAQKDVENFGWLHKDALGRIKSANADKVEPLSDSSMSVDQQVRHADNAKHDEAVQRWMSHKSPIVALYEFCIDKSSNYSLSDIKFNFYLTDNERFKCILTAKGKEYDTGISYPTRREAKNEIARYALRKLVNEVSEKSDSSMSMYQKK